MERSSNIKHKAYYYLAHLIMRTFFWTLRSVWPMYTLAGEQRCLAPALTSCPNATQTINSKELAFLKLALLKDV